MGKLIEDIEGAINAAVGKAKQRADDPSLHADGVEQEALGKSQQDERSSANPGDEDSER